jgi:hypothetical protein
MTGVTGWRPSRGVRQLFGDLQRWMLSDERRLRPILA